MATHVKAASCQPRRSHAVVGDSTRRLMVPSTPHSSRPLSRGRRDENVLLNCHFLGGNQEKSKSEVQLGISELARISLNYTATPPLHRYSPLCPAGACTTCAGDVARLATLEGESVGVKKKDKGKQKSRNQRRRDARGGT